MEEFEAYFYENAFLAYHEYTLVRDDGEMGNNKDRRAAIDAAVALYHLREHVPRPFRKRRDQLAALCPDYGLLGDIVNAAKHKVLTRGAPQVLSADDIREFLVCTTFRHRDGEYGHKEKLVEVELADGSKRDMYEILTNVVNMWFDELQRMGAAQRPPIPLKRQGLVSRADASSVALKMTKGFRWRQHFRLQEYNYESNEIEPVDLSDAEEIIFTVREPRTFEVEMGDATGPKLSKKVELTPEQDKELEQIHGADQRNEYLLGIAAGQGVMQQMIIEYQRAKN